MLIAASSGNFGQALAYACSLLKKSCIIVMPTSSAKVKVEAVRTYGGTVDFVNVQTKSRGARVQELAREHSDAYVASAYDDPLVIEGNSSLGRELASLHRRLDAVIVPIGGGGLISGVISGWNQMRKQVAIIGAEPFRGNDAARSLRSGRLVHNDAEPLTIADGARTISLGVHNWKIIQKHVSTIIEISEATIGEAVRVLFELANLKAEPTGALSVAALMTCPDLFRNRTVCCVVSGGNVDPGVYREIL